MDKKDWEKAKERLMLPFGSVKLIADGYAVTLQKVPVKDMFHNAIAVFINGEFKGKWLLEDCEERRRFIAQKAVPVMSRKAIAEYNKAPKAVRRKFKDCAIRKQSNIAVIGPTGMPLSSISKHTTRIFRW